MRHEGMETNPYIENPLTGEWKLAAVVWDEGADAYEEGLKKEGYGYVDGCSAKALEAFTNHIRTKDNMKGYIVFIEEE